MPRIKKPKKVKEPIRLRMKDLSDGSKSLYLDIYRNGKRTYEYLKLYLIPGTDNNTRRQNEITMAAANAIKSKRIIELTSGEAGIVNHTDKVYLLDWMQTYLEYQEKRDTKGIGQIKAVTHILKEYAGERFILDRVDLAFCQGYIDYMLTTFRPKGKPIAASTRNTYYQIFNGALNAAAAGEAVNWIGKIAQAHDKKLDKAIEKSKLRAQQLQYIYEQIDGILERFLGSGTELKLVDAENDRTRLNQLNNQIGAIRNKGKINIFDLMSLQKYKQEAEKLQKRVSAYDEGGAYGYQRALMQEQLSELEKQRQAEIDKKKTDDSKVADYENQIAEMKQQIKDFAEETAESLYGINLKDWASQLGDALYEAWQKGEDGAEAFKNKVADIMGDVMNSILKISILEPAMQQLQKMLFGEDGMSGYFGKDFSLDEKELESIADYLMGVSEKTDDYYSMLDKLNNYMEKKYGISMKEEEEDSGSGLSKGIQNVTENTANLLASYINAIRADVSVKREYVRRLVEELFPAYNVIAQAQLQQLTMIQINTAKNVEFVEEIRDILHRNINGVNKFNI